MLPFLLPFWTPPFISTKRPVDLLVAQAEEPDDSLLDLADGPGLAALVEAGLTCPEFLPLRGAGNLAGR